MISASSACAKCTFFDDHHGVGVQQIQTGGLCRFNPPVSQPGPDSHGLWPVVSETDWCGHFANEATPVMTAAE
ncbi:MAG: hypothetical protein ACRYGP_17805 [Janthinobacterium lividum]